MLASKVKSGIKTNPELKKETVASKNLYCKKLYWHWQQNTFFYGDFFFLHSNVFLLTILCSFLHVTFLSSIIVLRWQWFSVSTFCHCLRVEGRVWGEGTRRVLTLDKTCQLPNVSFYVKKQQQTETDSVVVWEFQMNLAYRGLLRSVWLWLEFLHLYFRLLVLF